MVRLSSEINELDQEELEDLRNELTEVKKKLRDSDRENTKLKKGMDRVNVIEAEKKKL